MANWYNQVFEKAPENGAPLILNELPTVIDPGDIDENLENIMKNKLDSVFSNKYNFRQLPTNEDEREKFLNNAKPRELNPAGIPNDVHGVAFQKAFQIEQKAIEVGSSLWGGFTYYGSYLLPHTYKIFRKQSAVTKKQNGGSSQKKMPYYNNRKTQRKK
jgi:hypothetical protein